MSARRARPAAAQAGDIEITPARLSKWPLPQPGDGGDKNERGRILVVAGAGEMPGAALLCAVAAMRAGAGKLQVATCASAAPLVALAVPEARVIALPETRAGRLAGGARAKLEMLSERADAIVVGPGLLDSAASARTLAAWLSRLHAVPVVIDAAALCAFEAPGAGVVDAPIARILTPHSGEAARLLGIERERIDRDPRGTALHLATRFDATVVMKGAVSWIVA